MAVIDEPAWFVDVVCVPCPHVASRRPARRRRARPAPIPLTLGWTTVICTPISISQHGMPSMLGESSSSTCCTFYTFFIYFYIGLYSRIFFMRVSIFLMGFGIGCDLFSIRFIDDSIECS